MYDEVLNDMAWDFCEQYDGAYPRTERLYNYLSRIDIDEEAFMAIMSHFGVEKAFKVWLDSYYGERFIDVLRGEIVDVISDFKAQR